MDASKRLVNLFYASTTLLTWVIFAKLFASVFTTFSVRDAHLLGRQFTTSTLLAAFSALALLFWAWRHPRYRPMTHETADELTKVTWPDWDDVKAHSKVTVIVTAIISLILWVFDQVFGNLTGWILGN